MRNVRNYLRHFNSQAKIDYCFDFKSDKNKSTIRAPFSYILPFSQIIIVDVAGLLLISLIANVAHNHFHSLKSNELLLYRYLCSQFTSI